MGCGVTERGQGDLGGQTVECVAGMLGPLHQRGKSESDANVDLQGSLSF